MHARENMGPGSAAHRRSRATRDPERAALRPGHEYLKRRIYMPDNPPIIAGTRIGHVHLKVADLDRALAFYCGVLGFEVTQRLSSGAAFISAGGYHHHIGLNTWESKGGHPPPPGTTGLFHTAILYPTRAALADALHRLIEAGIALDGASDHGVSEALYLRDPDENGVELYRDRPEAEWPRKPDGALAMFTKRLDLEELLRARQA
jgi:catechol 2,3-dioxygenase